MSQQTYMMSVKSQHSTFTVGFEADHDEAAIAHTVSWAAKAHIPKGSSVILRGPDGSVVEMGDVFVPTPEGGLGAAPSSI